ncbi:hypothetical protein [Candidatus Regiella endosymbiont of Tuberolachnus salignus]
MAKRSPAKMTHDELIAKMLTDPAVCAKHELLAARHNVELMQAPLKINFV